MRLRRPKGASKVDETQGQQAQPAQAATQISTETEASNTEQTQSAAPQPETGTDGKTAEQTNEQPKADWRELLNEVDPKELRKHPKFAGILGGELQRAMAQKEAELALQEAQRKENELLAQDDGPYAKHVKEQREAQTHEAAAWGEFDALANERVSSLPDDLKERIAGKFYPGTPGAARRAFLNELIDLEKEAVKRELSPSAMKKAADEAFEAGKKVAAGEAAQSGRVPSLGRGQAEAPELDQGEWNANRKNPDWRRNNRERIQAAVKAGRITH